jgi:hypothetical protein
MDKGLILLWTSFVDDNLAIIQKGSHDEILKALNSWDQNIKYTSEFLADNKLTFFIVNNFFEKWRYLISNIFTALNHSKQSCSNDDLFLDDLPIIEEIFLRNSYPEKILDEKYSNFLCSPEKPPQPEISFTFCIDYTNSKIEYH